MRNVTRDIMVLNSYRFPSDIRDDKNLKSSYAWELSYDEEIAIPTDALAELSSDEEEVEEESIEQL